MDACRFAMDDQKTHSLHFVASWTADRDMGTGGSQLSRQQGSFGEQATRRSKQAKKPTNQMTKHASGKRHDGSPFSQVKAEARAAEVKPRSGKQLVCYGFQRSTGCRASNCKFAHLRVFCEGDHPFERCCDFKE